MNRVLITNTPDTNADRLAVPCESCGCWSSHMLLIDHDDGGAIAVCQSCVDGAEVLAVDVEPRLVAMLVPEEHAGQALFALELARQWNRCRVPIPAKRLGDVRRWGHA